MSNLPVHPAIVHIPLGLAFVVPFVALGLLLASRRGLLPRRAFAVLVALQAVLVAGGVAAMQLGERDAHRIEGIVGEAAIETHEERAEAFVWTAGVVLAGTAAILVVPAGAVTTVAVVVAAGSLAVAGLALRAGEAGGELVYRHGAAAAWAHAGSVAPGDPAVPAAERLGRGREHDD